MPAVFKNAFRKIANNTAQTVYTVPSATATVAIGLNISNTGSSNITVDAYITSNFGGSSADYYIVKGAPVPPGGALVAIGNEQKVAMVINSAVADVLKVKSSSGTGDVDVTLSILENT
jgi:hypothetical protein